MLEMPVISIKPEFFVTLHTQNGEQKLLTRYKCQQRKEFYSLQTKCLPI